MSDSITRDDPLYGWLTLALAPGIGPASRRRLFDHFGSLDAILSADAEALREVAGDVRAAALARPDPQREQHIERALAWARAPQHHLLTPADPRYPHALLQIADPPALLFVVGRLEMLSRPMLAVVGSRNATADGAGNARSFSHSLSQAGWTIVSGMALGIDAAAHDGALLGGHGTVAVLGTGVDIIYPSRHRQLAARIIEDGALVSEFALGTAPVAGLFPRRNRLIAGMAQGVLVVEAALKSGSLITARLAADFGRDVFAIPGSIHSPVSRGCHALIRQGAALVESAQDVLSLYPPLSAEPAADSTSVATDAQDAATPDDPVLARTLMAIGHAPVLPDVLADHLGLPPGEVSAHLVMLELAGLLERRGDGRVVRTALAG